MFVESIKFQRIEESEWEEGYYIGETDNSKKSVILDCNYNEVPKNQQGFRVWDYKANLDKRLCLNIPNF